MTRSLESFVDRATAVLEVAPSSKDETRSWLVDPFLATLGWVTHTGEVTADVELEDTSFEYVCWIDSTPAVFVAVESATDPLTRERANEVLERMRTTGVDRAIYTNGRDFAFFTGYDADPTTCSIEEFVEFESTLDAFSATAARTRLARHSRALVARRLAVERESLVDAIADELAAVAGSAHRTEFEATADRYLATLLETFRPGSDENPDVGRASEQAPDSPARPEVDRSPTVGNLGTPSTATGSGSKPESNAAATEPNGNDSETRAGERLTERDETHTRDREEERAATGETASGSPIDTEASQKSTAGTTPAREAAADSTPAREAAVDTTLAREAGTSTDSVQNADDTDEGGEYVVRFFDRNRSIGAIGHSTSSGALVHAAEYLLERGLSGVRLPWTPEEGTVVLNDEPVRGDGTAMTAPEELSNGYYLETAGSVRDRARRVEALVSRAGLRAMLTGDWEIETESS